ncbi:MAG: DUF4347 domain-containing protein [Planctomycetota bacterium]
MEDRILFDAEMGEFVSEQAEEPLDSTIEQSIVETMDQVAPEDGPEIRPREGQTHSTHVAFVDITVDDFEVLVTELETHESGLDIVFLDPTRDGLLQIAESLNGRADLDAIHVISHGTDGELVLGRDRLGAETLQQRYQDTLSRIGQSLSENGDILLYGCDLAENEAGREFLTTLASLTGADMAASEDPTGNTQVGGDWDLEFRLGQVETVALWNTASGSNWAGLLAPTPSVTLNVPSESFLNESFDFSVTFENNSATPSDAGFAPYVDLHVPAGVNVTGASMFGATLTPTVAGNFNAGGDLIDAGGMVINHPVTGLAVSGNPGDQLLVYQLPFGSFVPGQPGATIDFSANLSATDGAQFGVPLDIAAQGFFALGADALDNPGVDPAIIGSRLSSPITPQIIDLTKTSDAPEDERSTGPNYPIEFTLLVDIADGETIDSLIVEDLLPESFAYLPGTLNVTSSAGFTVISTPSPGVAVNNRLAIDFGSVVGAAGVDATITYQVFVERVDAGGSNVLDPVSGAFVPTTNDAQATFEYQGTSLAVDDAGTDFTLSQESISLQKGVAVVNDLGGAGATPGDTLEYTLNIQVSDFFEFGMLRIDDTFSDGQLFDTTFAPTFAITEEGVSSSGTFSGSQFTVTHNALTDGTTDILFDLSSVVSDGVLTGDFFDDALSEGPTTVQIRFRTVIQENFLQTFPSGDPSVDTGDRLTNDATVTGQVTGGAIVSDGSGTSISITGPVIAKSIYAIDGDTSRAGDPIVAGHTITYRLEFDMPTADFENLILTDFLPIPIYDATEITSILNTPSLTPPPAGAISYHLDHTLAAVAPLTDPPLLTTDAATNSVRLEFGSFDVEPSVSAKIDVLFTVTATDARFADGLLLTNQANATYGLTTTETATSDSIVQNSLAAPELNVTKGIVSSDGVAPIFSNTPGPAAFAMPGVLGIPFAGSITSAGLASNPIDSDLSDIDAGDRFRVAIVIENTGEADGFNLSLTVVLAPQYAIAGSGLNLQVHRGDGAMLSFSGDLFAGGIEIVDPGTGDGAINSASDGAADGTNIIIVTYDAELQTNSEINQTYTTSAEVTGYGTVDGGE